MNWFPDTQDLTWHKHKNMHTLVHMIMHTFPCFCSLFSSFFYKISLVKCRSYKYIHFYFVICYLFLIFYLCWKFLVSHWYLSDHEQFLKFQASKSIIFLGSLRPIIDFKMGNGHISLVYTKKNKLLTNPISAFVKKTCWQLSYPSSNLYYDWLWLRLKQMLFGKKLWTERFSDFIMSSLSLFKEEKMWCFIY